MFLGSGVQNNANTPAINSQALTANLPPPGYPNRWVLDEQAKKLYIDTGTALVLVLDGSGAGGSQNLQSVTGIGNTTTLRIGAAGFDVNGAGGAGYINLHQNAPTTIPIPANGVNVFSGFVGGVSSLGFRNTLGGVSQFNPVADGISRVYTLPSGTNGTLALLSDLALYVPYDGATKNLNLGGNNLTASVIQAIGGYLAGNAATAGSYSMFVNGFLQTIIADIATDANVNYTLPYHVGGGTIALRSDFSMLVPYDGATKNLNLGGNNLTANNVTTPGSVFGRGGVVVGQSGGGAGLLVLWDSASHQATIQTSVMQSDQTYVLPPSGGTFGVIIQKGNALAQTVSDSIDLVLPFSDSRWQINVSLFIRAITAGAVSVSFTFINNDGASETMTIITALTTTGSKAVPVVNAFLLGSSSGAIGNPSLTVTFAGTSVNYDVYVSIIDVTG